MRRQLRNIIFELGTNTNPLIVWAVFFGTGYFWNTTLGVIEEQFARFTGGLALLDTQVFFAAARILQQNDLFMGAVAAVVIARRIVGYRGYRQHQSLTLRFCRVQRAPRPAVRLGQSSPSGFGW